MTETERREAQVKLGEAYRRMFDTADGKMILKDLAYYCYENDSTYDINPQTMAFNEGRRSVILKIRQVLDTDPKVEIQREA